MSMHSNEDRGPLDSAIDRAVRGMMQVDPRPGLRHRVAGRLEAPARRASWMLPAAAAAALLGVVVVSSVLFRAPGAPPASQPQMAISPGTRLDAGPTVPVPVPVQPVAGAPRSPARQRPPRVEAEFGPRRDRVAAANVEPVAAIAPAPGVSAAYEPPPFTGALAPLAPILIAPIEVEPITIAPLTVSTLPIRK
jgi:hypothetical protein